MYGAYGDNNFLYPMEPKGAYGDNNLQVFAFRYFWDFQHCFAKIDSVFLELVRVFSWIRKVQVQDC